MAPKRSKAAAPAKKSTVASTSTAPAKVSKAAPKTEASNAANTSKKVTNGTAARGCANKSTTPAAAPKPKTARQATKAAAPKATKATASKKTTTKKAAPSKRKRNESEDEQEDTEEEEPTMNGVNGSKAAAPKRAAAKPAAKRPAKRVKVEPKINEAPAEKLHIFVFGEGTAGELGLGTAKAATDVKRPRLNQLLAANTVGVVQVSTGGMHVVALTHDNKILTWGVNDQGALGRDTTWEGGLKDVNEEDSDSDDSDSDSGMNPHEATPTAISSDAFPEGTKFVQVAAGDSTSFALTDSGLVYGWGNFRTTEGVWAFSRDAKGNITKIQKTPTLLPQLKKIKQISAGANHVCALDEKGNVWAWGSGQQNQLGRRIIERRKAEGLDPQHVTLPKNKVTYVECGSNHSFAVDKDDNVWSWGLNNFGQTGLSDNAGGSSAAIISPAKVPELCGKGMKVIHGGQHHSVGVAGNGDCMVWGRMDGHQMGIDINTLPLDDETKVVRDDSERKAPRILLVPTKVPIPACSYATASSDHSIAVTEDGRAYSWGFNANYQCGQGTDDDIPTATLIDNTAVRTKKLNWAGAGGQFSVLTAPAEDVEMADGA